MEGINFDGHMAEGKCNFINTDFFAPEYFNTVVDKINEIVSFINTIDVSGEKLSDEQILKLKYWCSIFNYDSNDNFALNFGETSNVNITSQCTEEKPNVFINGHQVVVENNEDI